MIKVQQSIFPLFNLRCSNAFTAYLSNIDREARQTVSPRIHNHHILRNETGEISTFPQMAKELFCSKILILKEKQNVQLIN